MEHSVDEHLFLRCIGTNRLQREWFQKSIAKGLMQSLDQNQNGKRQKERENLWQRKSNQQVFAGTGQSKGQ